MGRVPCYDTVTPALSSLVSRPCMAQLHDNTTPPNFSNVRLDRVLAILFPFNHHHHRRPHPAGSRAGYIHFYFSFHTRPNGFHTETMHQDSAIFKHPIPSCAVPQRFVDFTNQHSPLCTTSSDTPSRAAPRQVRRLHELTRSFMYYVRWIKTGAFLLRYIDRMGGTRTTTCRKI